MGVGREGVCSGRRTVLWAIPPAWPLALGRHQGVRLCVIVQVLLAASTSMRAAGKRGLGGRGGRLGPPSPQPWAELMQPSPMGPLHSHATLTGRMGAGSPQCLLCVPWAVAVLMGCQHRREPALGVSPQQTPTDGERMGGYYGTGAPGK